MLKSLIDIVWGIGGVFMLFWYNSFFVVSYGWVGWVEVYE